ncbi:unnamed protein product, partial [Oppiella nova]
MVAPVPIICIQLRKATLSCIIYHLGYTSFDNPAYDWPIIPGYPCPPREIARTKCLGPKDCLYPNPRDCSRFIQCNDASI